MILEVFQVDVYFCILPTNCKHRQSFSFMKNISISLLLLPSRDGVEGSPWVHGIKFRPRAIRIMHCILHSNCEHLKLFQTQATGDPFINSLFANIINVCTEYCIACILRSVPGTMHRVTLTCHVVMCHDMSRANNQQLIPINHSFHAYIITVTFPLFVILVNFYFGLFVNCTRYLQTKDRLHCGRFTSCSP